MNLNVNLNGGTVMTRRLLAIVAIAALSLGLVACGDEPNNINLDGVMPVANSEVQWDPSQCEPQNVGTELDECFVDEICVFNTQASSMHGMDLYRCEPLCDADFETIQHEDGTSETIKVYDSCQRFGDDTVYCDMDLEVPTCVEYTEPASDPCADCNQQPEQPVEPEEPVFATVTCCFAQSLVDTGKYVNFGWSTSTSDEPENWNADWDLVMDENGCGTSAGKIEMALWFDRMIWVELTQGTVAVDHSNWLGGGENDEFAPLSCTVNGEDVPVGPHMEACGYGFDNAVGLSCHE